MPDLLDLTFSYPTYSEEEPDLFDPISSTRRIEGGECFIYLTPEGGITPSHYVPANWTITPITINAVPGSVVGVVAIGNQLRLTVTPLTHGAQYDVQYIG